MPSRATMAEIETHEHDADDPFDVFGDSDSDSRSDGGEEASTTIGAARSLVEEANARMRSNTRTSSNKKINNSLSAEAITNAIATQPKHCNEGSDNGAEAIPHLQSALPSQWPDRPALYLGPMVAGPVAMGGGRGYIATRDLEPGTLLLAEIPIWTWPMEQQRRELSFVSILNIVRHDNAARIVCDMELLHPTMVAVDNYLDRRRNSNSTRNGDDSSSKSISRSTVDQIDKMMAELERKHGRSVILQDILDVSKQRNITRSDGQTMLSTDVYRMLLALRYNGFETGVYLHFSIFNHDEDPNSIKFTPTGTQSDGNATDDDELKSCSEIRTTRYVKRGESLTISYLNPREVSHATRRHHLWDQHRFDVGDDLAHNRIRQFELVRGTIPKSSKGRRYDDTTHRIETVVSELEEQMDEIKDAFATGNFVPEQVERAKAIEVAASLELISTATQQLENDKHILMVRCYRLHLDASEALLKADVAAGLSNSQRNGVTCRFVETARKLLNLQILYLGEHHVDVGRTHQDVAQGINTLLSRSPRKLFELNLDGMKNFAQCSREEHRCQREYERIRALYASKPLEAVLSLKA